MAPQSRSPELIFVDLCSMFQAGAVGNGPGPNFGRKPTQNPQKLKPRFQFPNISPSQLGCSIMFSGPGSAFRGRPWPLWAGNLPQTDPNPVSKRPGLRPGYFGTGFWPAIGLRPKTGPGAGSTNEQPKVVGLGSGWFSFKIKPF